MFHTFLLLGKNKSGSACDVIFRYKVCKKQRDAVVFLRKTVGSKGCVSYKGLTKYSKNLVNTGALEGAISVDKEFLKLYQALKSLEFLSI